MVRLLLSCLLWMIVCAARALDAQPTLRVVEGPFADVRRDDAQLGVRVLGSAEGLPQLTVFALADGADGLLYVGTQDGLARWDGRRFERVDLPDGRRDWVTHLHPTAHGLYVGTDDHGLLWLDLAQPQAAPQLVRVPGPDGAALPAIEALGAVRGGPEDAAWVGTPKGLWHCTPRACEAVPGTADLEVSEVLDTAAGLWVGTNMDGLYRLDRAAGAPWPTERRVHLQRADGLPNNAIRGLVADRRDRLWIATGRGLARYEPGFGRLTRWTRIDAQTPLGSVFGLRLLTDGRVVAALWLNGLAEFRPDDDGFRITGLAQGLPDAYLNHVHASGDAEAPILWLGSSSSGVVRLEPGRWRSFDERHGLPQRVVVGVGALRAPDGSGREALWAGTLGGAVWRAAGDSRWSSLLPVPWQARVVYDVVEDPNGRRWFATDRGVLLDDHGRWHEYDADRHAVPATSVESLEWVAGRLWLGTGHGLGEMTPDPEHPKPDNWRVRRRYEADPRFADMAVRSWLDVPGRPSERLLGSGDGVIHVDAADETRIARLPADCAGGRLVYDMAWVVPGVAWLATRSGVQVLHWPDHADPAQARCTALPEPALAGVSVYELAVDAGHGVWLFGYDGARRAQLDGSDVRELTVHGLAEGLPGLEFNRAALVDASGRLWAANAQGLALFDPAEPPRVPRQPKLKLHGWHDDQPLLDGQRLSAAAAAELRLQPRLLSFRAEHRIRYQVQLQGLEQGASAWLPDGDRHYPRLPPGSYRFVVRARDAAGIEHGPVTLGFSVAAPWWLHPVALAGAVLALVAAGLWVGRLRARALAQRAARLEALVAARTAELERASNTDPLTGAANRRCFQQNVADWLAALRERGGAALVLLDVDHFKQINDAHGHSGGDLVLVELAARLRAVDPAARLVRWGGEEFLLLLPAAAGEPVLAGCARRVLKCLEAPVQLPGGMPLLVRASVGLTHAWPPRGTAALATEQLDALIARADQALYRAKQDGRDCAWAALEATLPGSAAGDAGWRFERLLCGAEARAGDGCPPPA